MKIEAIRVLAISLRMKQLVRFQLYEYITVQDFWLTRVEVLVVCLNFMLPILICFQLF